MSTIVAFWYVGGCVPSESASATSIVVASSYEECRSREFVSGRRICLVGGCVSEWHHWSVPGQPDSRKLVLIQAALWFGWIIRYSFFSYGDSLNHSARGWTAEKHSSEVPVMPRDCRRLGPFSSDSSSESVMLLKKYRLAIFLLSGRSRPLIATPSGNRASPKQLYLHLFCVPPPKLAM